MNRKFSTLGTAPLTAANAAAGDFVPIVDVSTSKLMSMTMSEAQKVAQPYAADTGAADAYVVTLAPAPTAYVEGFSLMFKAAHQNTGACTLNVNGLGAKSIKKQATVDPSAADIKSGQIVRVTYDGTNFQIV